MEQDKPFPPEMLQMIFNWVGSRKQLCSLRLVCKEWNASVISLLGQRKIAQEMEWRPTEEFQAEPNSLVPKLAVMPTATELITEVLKPNGEKELGIEEDKMGLPTESLHLVIQMPPDGKRPSDISTETEKEESISVLFKSFENSVTFLCISGVKLNMSELCKILCQTKKLRALKISEDFLMGWSFIPSGCLKEFADELPKLQHLSLLNVESETPGWLIQTFAPHLQTLEVSNAWVRVGNLNEMPQLKKLKLERPHSKFLRLLEMSQMTKLERLSIKNSLSTTKELLQFVKSFQNTLVELTLEYISTRDKTEDFSDWEPPRFQKLSRLCLISLIMEAQSKIEEQLLNSSFPLIKVLHFRNLISMSREDASEYSSVHNHWNIIPSLESIEWVTSLFKKKKSEDSLYS